ncbi:MAG TPA: glycine--tRNA ligase subunit beta [Firmicutes bacterium]|nr:glycine--tRNA ligase subunit beta [Bacillota bacterium]
MRRDAVLEIGCEEIPARFMPDALSSLRALAGDLLSRERLKFDRLVAYGTPRRLVLYISNLNDTQDEAVRQVRGPAKRVAFDESGKPTKAALGFAKAQGIPVEELVIRADERGEYVYAELRQPGESAAVVLGKVFPRLIGSLPFPRTMRWGDSEMRFVRPVRWLLALFGNQVVEFEVDGVSSGDITFGHRFLSPGPVRLGRAEDYVATMRGLSVLVDPAERRESILAQASRLAAQAGGRVVAGDDLLSEIVFLCEHPRGMLGRFDREFLSIPRAVLTTTMEKHQRYLPVEDESGRLLPCFIAFRDGGDLNIEGVTRGNERVLRARLSDARFFYDEDRKIPLEGYLDRLSGIMFLGGLGTVRDKVDRLVRLVEHLARQLGVSDEITGIAKRAALLCKADLATNMVREFTELQGVMGREYAISSGEDPGVAEAIFEHYLPRSSDDALPGSPAGAILSIADKADTIVACFLAGLEPTGSQDPYALRRQASGIISTIVAQSLKLSLGDLVGVAARGLLQQGLSGESPQDLDERVLDFMAGRLKGYLLERDVRYDLVDAVIAAGFDDIAGAVKRAYALKDFSGKEEFQLMATGFTRAANIAGTVAEAPVDESLLVEDAERALYGAYVEAARRVRDLARRDDPAEMIRAFAELASPIDRFFTEVLVMAEDERIRRNRLNLLAGIAALMKGVADMSKVVVKSG